MTAAPRRRHVFSDYLSVEEMSPHVKHEFVAGEIFAMAGGTVEHAALSSAMAFLLTRELQGGSCRAYSSDLRIFIAPAQVGTYADCTVVCDPIERAAHSPTHVVNPRVIVEVLSPSTEAYDLGEKRGYYQQLASLRAYVVVAQDRRRVQLWARDDEGGAWRHTTHQAGGAVPLPSLGLAVDVDELYRIAGVAVA